MSEKPHFSLSHVFPSIKANPSQLVCVGGMEEQRNRGSEHSSVCFHSVYKDVGGQKHHEKGHKSQGPVCPWPYKHASTGKHEVALLSQPGPHHHGGHF